MDQQTMLFILNMQALLSQWHQISLTVHSYS